MSAYIDTSALAKCYVRELRSLDVLDWVEARDEIVTSPLTLVEFRCLLARRRRSGQIDHDLEHSAMSHFEGNILDRTWRILPEAPRLFEEARLLIDQVPDIPLRALDAVHIAFARRFGATEFASADRKQAQAAQALGMTVFTFHEL